MSTGILVVTKVADGQEWGNTYAISVGSSAGPLTLADLEGIVATNPPGGFTDNATEPSATDYAGATSIIAAILGFERKLHYNTVQFTRLNLSDAVTPGTPTGPFWSQAINLQGIRSGTEPVADDTVAPLNVALLVNRNAAALSVRPGRLYLRACLVDTQVKPGSRVGVTWKDQTTADTYATYFNTLPALTHLSDYFASPITTLPEIYLSIPHLAPAGEGGEVIINGSPVQSLSVNKPVSRQLTRGRRRRVAA